MSLVPMRELLQHSSAARRAVAAFNVISLEHAEGILAGAAAAGLPVILQLSENAVRFHGSPGPIARATRLAAEESPATAALHLDHVTDPELARMTAELGFSSLMFDASRSDYADNVASTAEIAQWCRENDLWLEAELGEVGGKDGAHAPGARTDPDDAARFVAATHVDALAVAVGSSHAMIEQTSSLDHELIARLHAAVDVPLVLHGSSGVPDEQLQAAVAAGMVKINIGTALNTAYTGAVRSYLDANPRVVDPRKYTEPGRQAIADTVQRYLELLARAAD